MCAVRSSLRCVRGWLPVSAAVRRDAMMVRWGQVGRGLLALRFGDMCIGARRLEMLLAKSQL
eukprot:6315820-Prymnesium_polylepis.1